MEPPPDGVATVESENMSIHDEILVIFLSFFKLFSAIKKGFFI
jgi:hypothetical protein